MNVSKGDLAILVDVGKDWNGLFCEVLKFEGDVKLPEELGIWRDCWLIELSKPMRNWNGELRTEFLFPDDNLRRIVGKDIRTLEDEPVDISVV